MPSEGLLLTCEEHGDGIGASLEGRADGEDDDGQEHGALPAKVVGNGAVDERSEPRAQEQRRDEPALEAAVEEDAREVGRERLHGQNARHHALVVAKEEAA